MSEVTTIARPYAKAAFEFAVEQKAVDSWLSMLLFAAEVSKDSTLQQVIHSSIAPEQLAAVNGRIPMGWTGDPIDIAHGVLYFASDDARYVTGAELIIDGGWYAGAGSMIDAPEPEGS